MYSDRQITSNQNGQSKNQHLIRHRYSNRRGMVEYWREKTKTLLDAEPWTSSSNTKQPGGDPEWALVGSHGTPTTRGCYMILQHMIYVIVPDNRDKFNNQCRNNMPPWHRSCIISHLPHVAEIIARGRLDQYRNDMPPWISCIISHLSRAVRPY